MKTSTRLLFPLLLAPVAAAQAPLYDLSGQLGDGFGRSVAWIGDLDGDGLEDIAVGAPDGDGEQPDAGYVRIFSAASGHELLTIPGEVTGDDFGWAIAGLGDIDGDGIGDLIIGAPLHEGTTGGVDRGAIYLFSGASGAWIWKIGGWLDHDHAGWTVAGPGDVDGDGIRDYAFGVPEQQTQGGAWILSGADHSALRFYVGQNAGDSFGFAIAAAGDINNDGFPDLVAGAPGYDLSPSNPDAGRAFALSGAASNTSLFWRTGTAANGQVGYSVAGGFDADADGRPDVAIGEPGASANGANAGRVLVLSGANQATLHTIEGSAGDALGSSVGGILDVDLDGHGDVLAGAPGADVGGLTDAGRAMVYSGQSGALLFEMVGYHDFEGFGISVAGAGRLNADLATDVIAGSPGFDGNVADGGRARIVLGDAPYPTWYCTPKVNSAGCTPLIYYTGCASFSAGNYFVVHASNVLPNKLGILIWSLAPNATPFAGGTLCVGTPVKRTPSQTSIVTGPGACDARYEFSFNATYMASKGLVPGLEVHAQYWSRDNGFAPPNNAGLTGGLEFTTLP